MDKPLEKYSQNTAKPLPKPGQCLSHQYWSSSYQINQPTKPRPSISVCRVDKKKTRATLLAFHNHRSRDNRCLSCCHRKENGCNQNLIHQNQEHMILWQAKQHNPKHRERRHPAKSDLYNPSKPPFVRCLFLPPILDVY